MLSSKAKYAVRAATMLAERADSEAWTQTAEIAERERIPRKFLEAILVQLRDHGIVESRRGSHGGHHLSREPSEILGRRHHPHLRRAAGADAVRQRDTVPSVHRLRRHRVLPAAAPDATGARCGGGGAGELLARRAGDAAAASAGLAQDACDDLRRGARSPRCRCRRRRKYAARSRRPARVSARRCRPRAAARADRPSVRPSPRHRAAGAPRPCEPAIAPVAPGSVFSRRASSDVASAASAMLRAISVSPPRRVMEVDGNVGREPGARVARAGPVELLEESLAQSMRDRHRMQVGLAVRPRVQETPIPSARTATCGSCRRTSQRRGAHVERHLGRRVRAVDQHRNAGRVAHIDDALQRQHERAGRGDVVHHCEASSAGVSTAAMLATIASACGCGNGTSASTIACARRVRTRSAPCCAPRRSHGSARRSRHPA